MSKTINCNNRYDAIGYDLWDRIGHLSLFSANTIDMYQHVQNFECELQGTIKPKCTDKHDTV